MRLLKSINKLFNNLPKELFLLAFGWRLLIFIVTFFALSLVPLNSKNFLGGGFDSYQQNPYLYAWANFDGEHYLSIATQGYSSLNHSFFPLYPLLISLIFGVNNTVLIGLLISNLCIFAAAIIFYKLVRLDFSKEIAFLSLVLLLLFPNSFFFTAMYTESLFLLFSIGCFYLARKKRWWLASVLGALASATRITGVILLPALLVEWYIQKSSKINLIPIFLISLGLLGYMLYLYVTVGNALAFYNEVSNFGVQRQGQFVSLPQVFYRYAKILLTPNLSLLTIWTTVIELFSAILVLSLVVLGYLKKVRLSYLVYTFLAFLVPTFTGSFSSMPRYSLVLFPIFIVSGMFITEFPKLVKFLILLVSIILLTIETSLFLRGYWVS